MGREDVQPGEKVFITAKLGAGELFVQFTVRDGSKFLLRDFKDRHLAHKFFPAKRFHLSSYFPKIPSTSDLVRRRLGNTGSG